MRIMNEIFALKIAISIGLGSISHTTLCASADIEQGSSREVSETESSERESDLQSSHYCSRKAKMVYGLMAIAGLGATSFGFYGIINGFGGTSAPQNPSDGEYSDDTDLDGIPTTAPSVGSTIWPTIAPIQPTNQPTEQASAIPSNASSSNGPKIDLRFDFPDAAHKGMSSGAKAVKSYIEKNQCVASAIVAKNGEIVAEYYDGTNRDKTEHLFSSTKSVISILFGLMEEEGFINLDDRLVDIWPIEEEENRVLWNKIEDSEYKRNIKIESLLTHTSGLEATFLDFENDPLGAILDIFTILADFGTTGGISMVDSLNDSKYVFPKALGNNTDHIERCTEVTKENQSTHLSDTMPTCRRFNYYGAGNIYSYIIKKKTGLTPKEYALKKFFPALGIEDPKWLVNFDHVEYSGAGLKLTGRQHLKIAQFMLQGGQTSAHSDSKILTDDWLSRATGKQVRRGENQWYGYQWYIENGNRYNSHGVGGQIIFVNEESNTVASIFTDEECMKDAFLKFQIANPSPGLFKLIDSANFEIEELEDIEDSNYCRRYSNPEGRYNHCSPNFLDATKRNWMLKYCAKSCSERYF